jgi:hypothetical protein
MNDALNAGMGFIEPQHDVIPLPSNGLFYKNKKKSVKVAYLTASDENILVSPNLLESNKVIDVLLQRKIIEQDFKAADMLDGDRLAVLFFLRATGYGEEYPVTLIDPKTGKDFEYTFNLSEIKPKEITLAVDDSGEALYTLKNGSHSFKFSYLTAKEEDELKRIDEEKMRKLGSNAISELLTARLCKQVKEIDGNRDRGFIDKFINEMRPMFSNELRKYIMDNEPGLDLEKEVKAPSGTFFRSEIPITPQFFWPYL